MPRTYTIATLLCEGMPRGGEEDLSPPPSVCSRASERRCFAFLLDCSYYRRIEALRIFFSFCFFFVSLFPSDTVLALDPKSLAMVALPDHCVPPSPFPTDQLTSSHIQTSRTSPYLLCATHQKSRQISRSSFRRKPEQGGVRA